jgi:hypothetical protein
MMMDVKIMTQGGNKKHLTSKILSKISEFKKPKNC